jgi:crotonobetainyl-CoA:carnitine CoA-transferase CaiB-like acyl-CoA transferase
MSDRALHGLRVLEIATEIAGPYAGKLFVDAGADAVKVEPETGDPLRTWTYRGSRESGDGALFQYLNAGKRSVCGDASEVAVQSLATLADIIIIDSGTNDEAAARLGALAPHAVIASITPWGRGGPWSGIPANEFTLQAAAGSTGNRGRPEGRPLAAGGRLGEWLGGSFAAVSALAYSRRRAGEFIDVSLLEVMAITMGGLAAVSAQITEGSSLPTRFLELPSVERTADGYVGFCTITAQQFQDFLILIERPDWLDDTELHTSPGRVRRRVAFNAAVHGWTASRTTAEIIDAAVALRIPVAPIGDPESIPSIDQFVARGVFVENPGGFVQPRPPYRIGTDETPEIRPAPQPGEHEGLIGWAPRDQAAKDAPEGLPLDDLTVLDLTAFWAGPSATLLLASLGADVVKLEGVKRPDGMRFAATKPPTTERWWETGAMFISTNSNKRSVTLELSSLEGQRLARDLVRSCDIVIENFSPRVIDNLGLSWAAVTAANPRAVMVRMPAFGLDGPWRDRGGFAQTMEQVSGMAWMTGEPDEAPVIPRGACDPLAGLHGAFAALAAIEVRDATGAGSLVEATMVEAALNIAAPVVIEHSAYGAVITRDGNRDWSVGPQGVYACAAAETWIAISVVSDRDWDALISAIGAPEELLEDPALMTAAGRRSSADLIDRHIEAWTNGRSLVDAVEALRGVGVPCAAVILPSDLLDQPQLQARGFFERVEHPVAGPLRLPGLPFRVAGRSSVGWIRQPAPTMGQHSAAILSTLAGLAPADFDELLDSGISAVRPAGL